MPKGTGHGGIYRDSISRCDHYSNPYDSRYASNPAMNRYRADEYARSKDVIVSAQKKLEIQLLEKLLLKFPKGRFVIIGTLGKYAFLVIMLPPYIFLYGLPKWLLLEGMPRAYNAFKRGAKAFRTKLEQPFKAAWNAIQRPFIVAYQRTKELVDNALARFRQLAQATLDGITYPWRLFHKKVIQPLRKGYEAAREAVAAFEARMRTLRDMIRKQRKALSDLAKSIRKTAAQMASAPKEWLNKLRNIPNPFVLGKEWLYNKFRMIARFPSDLYEELKKRMASASERLIKRPISFVHEQLNKALDYARQSMNALKNRVNEWTEPLLSYAQSLFAKRKGWDEVFKKFRKEGLIEGFKQIGKEVAAACNRGLKMAAKIVTEFSRDLVHLLPMPVVTLFSPFTAMARFMIKAPGKIYQSRHGAYNKLKMMKGILINAFHEMHARAKKLLILFAKGWVKAQNKIMEGLAKAGSFLARFFLLLWEILKRFAYLLRILMAWAKVLFQYGMEQVRESAQRLTYIK